jgi:sulfotransferase
MYGIFNGYYKHINKDVIFDGSRSWTRRTNFLQELFPYTKILCPVRDIVSILNSFELISLKNPFYTKTITKNNCNIYERCDEMMNQKYGVVSNPWISLKEGYALNPKMIYFIEYEQLCKDPENTMKDVYKFLEQPYYHHDFNNVKYSNEIFDKECNLEGLHTIRSKVEYNPPKNILPPEIVQKYSELNMEFWKLNYKSNFNVNSKFFQYK